jgi:hypothetical protein
MLQNTQSGSQWDGFKHFGHADSDSYYNGLKHDEAPNSLDNGIHHWNDRGEFPPVTLTASSRFQNRHSWRFKVDMHLPFLILTLTSGGIVGRGVLLDYVRYAEKKGIKYDVMSRHQISVAAMKEMAQDQGTELKPGDIFIIRSGTSNKLSNLD